MSQAWLRQPERGSVGLLRFAAWLAHHAGRNATGLLLYPITVYYILTSAAGRDASRDYLARVLAEPPRWRQVFAHFFCFAQTILDRILLLAGRTDGFELAVFDRDGLLERARRGQGCLLLGAHLGSFDMLRLLAVEQAGLKLKILMRPDHNQMITSLLAALNPAVAATLQPIAGPADMLRLRELLAAGYVVGLLADRATPEDRLVTVDFLGGQAALPATPIQLASRLGVPVFTCVGLYLGGRRYEAHFDLLAEQIVIPRSAAMDATRLWVERYAAQLARYLKLAPYNWFNFYLFWQA